MQTGQSVLVAPKLSLDISPDNTNPSPVNPDVFQTTHATALDITCSKARGVIGSPDRTQAIKAEVDHFFGTAAASDFNVTGNSVVYAGAADDCGYRRFILHYAHLCAAAGGVSAFLIGSDLAGLTQLRDDQGRFITVDALAQLARDVRAILGSQVKLGYAADWREYGAYVPSDAPEDMYFPLDALWAEPAINFVGVNARIPLADWRDGDTHLDRAWQSPENPDYLQRNVEGGEGYAWHYPTFEDRTRQNRVDLIDRAHNEHWAIRPKDIKGWWQHTHHERINGIRQTRATLWAAQSKPIWLLNVGCAAVDKGANDPATPAPWFSTGLRDDSMQYAYAQCLLDYWNDSVNNPMSEAYDAPMIDTDAVFVTHWDARPYPWYPSAQGAWTDAARHETGYTLNGRASHVPLSTAVEEVCTFSGLSWPRTDRLWGIIRGYQVRAPVTGRAILQPLAAAHGFDAVEQNGSVQFIPRRGQVPTMIDPTEVVASNETSGDIETMRSSAAEITGRVQVLFEEADADFSPISEEVVLPYGDQQSVSRQELPMVISRSEARQIIETWLAEAHLSRETCRFGLPPSQKGITAGSLLCFADAPDVTYRVDRVERGEYLMIDATRHDPNVRQVSPPISTKTHVTPYVPPLSVDVTFLDLPMLKSDQIAHAPYVVATGDPWPGPIAVYAADEGADFEHLAILNSRATKGVLKSSLPAGVHSRLQHGQSLDVVMSSGHLHSVSMLQMLNGANTAAVGNASLNQWEIIQFQSVELLSRNTYRLSNLVRGKFGSHAEDHEGWAKGTDFILLHAGIDQLPMSEENRTTQRTYRFGPSGRAYNHPAYREEIRDFSARGLRPLSPCHLRWQEIAEGWKITWIRRGRIDADTWEGVDIPLGEESELYRLRVLRYGQEVMEFTTTSPQVVISTAQITTHDLDLQDRHTSIEVSQISNAYGPGIAAVLEIG